MRLDEFQQLVAAHPDHYTGVHRHSDTDLTSLESAIGHRFPSQLRWLLGTHGYAAATGVDALEEAVRTTLACRMSMNLPSHQLVLNDWGDAGVVLLDLVSGRCCWCGSHDVERIARGEEPVGNVDWFEDYAAWSKARLDDALEAAGS